MGIGAAGFLWLWSDDAQGAIAALVIMLAVLLKGAAYSALGDRYRFFRFRPAVDVDLLVEPGSAERAWQSLTEAGFPRADAGPSLHPDHHHLPTLVGDFRIPVEIHVSASLLWPAEQSWSRMAGSAREVVWQGMPVLVPAPTELLWHAVSHSLGDGASGCRLRSFLTAAALVHNGGEVNWEVISERIEAEPVYEHDSRKRVRPLALKRWLAVAAWLGCATLPSGIARDIGAVDLARLVEFRRRRLARWSGAGPVPSRAERWIQEAARAELGLGTSRLAHWLPRRFRPRRMAASVVYQVLYRAAR